MIFVKIDFRSQKVLKKNLTRTPIKRTQPDNHPDKNCTRTLVRIKSQLRQPNEPKEKKVSPKVINLNFPAIPILHLNISQEIIKTPFQIKTSRSHQPAPIQKPLQKLSPSSQKRKIVYSKLKTSS